MRFFNGAATMIALVGTLSISQNCAAQDVEPVDSVIPRALANLRVERPDAQNAGSVEIMHLYETGRISARHGDGRLVLDSVMAMVATDPREGVSSLVCELLKWINEQAGDPPVISLDWWLQLYRTVTHSATRLGIMWLALSFPAAEAVPALGQMAVASQCDPTELQWAVDLLLHPDEGGRAELRRLLDAGAFTDVEARAWVEYLIGEGD
jgi:hypothetical protein